MENRYPTFFAGQQAWKLLPYALLGKHERAFQHLVPKLEDADVAFELRSRGDNALLSPLLLAVAMGDEALVRRFARIPRFLDHAFEDAWGQRMTPLYLAVTKENAAATVRCLVDAGADVFQGCRVRPDDEWLKLDTTTIRVAAALGNVDTLVAFFQKSLECGQAERLLLDTVDGKGRRPWEKCADQRTFDVFNGFLSEILDPRVSVSN
ncbi:hypothetical protein NpNSSI1_00005151 [Neofusicoccum parvum]|nr:hypothetical protein NpNSSI1_00005151 [Neofusicoccum parvum]